MRHHSVKRKFGLEMNQRDALIRSLARKKEVDILDVEGLGSKGVQEIKKKLSNYNITLK